MGVLQTSAILKLTPDTCIALVGLEPTFLLERMKNELLLAIGQLAAEKNLSRDIVYEAIEAALSSAYRSDGEPVPNVYVKLNHDTGEFMYYRQMAVVDEVEDDEAELSLPDAKRYKPDVATGDVLDFEVRPPENAGRIAAQTAKQVVMVRLREAEREAVFQEYGDKVGELLVGTVQRVEPRSMTLDLGRGTEAILPMREQVRNEHPRPGQRMKVVILDVSKDARGPQIEVSRSHRTLLRRLLEVEVPEIRSGVVEIKSIAREGGHRSKIAVHCQDPRVDPIGACVGIRGTRIQNVVNELGGERVDVIKWDPDPATFVSNALSPAQVLETETNTPERRASVTVPDRMYSLAIGKEGQNARLAAKLTGWWIDIRTESAAAREPEGVIEAPSTFEPFRPGEEPDLDFIATAEEPEPVAVTEPVAATAVEAEPAIEEGTEESAVATTEDDVTFVAGLQEVPIPDRDERESEDYGEEASQEDEEEYEIPDLATPEERPTAIRFAEDVLPRRTDEEDATKKKRQRYHEEEGEDDDEYEYSGRIR